MKKVWIDYDERYPDFDMVEGSWRGAGYSEDYRKRHEFEVTDEFFEEYKAVSEAYMIMQNKLRDICGYDR